MHETLSENNSTDVSESERNIINQILSQNNSADVEKLCSTEEDKSEYTIIEQKDEGNEVAYNVPNYNVSNVSECRRNNPDVPYERASWPLKEMNTVRRCLTI